MSVSSCTFCRIASGELTAEVLLRSRHAVAFLDLNPIRPGHALVVPVRHETEFLNLEDGAISDLMSLARRVADAQWRIFAPRKIGLLVAGFDVPHAHMHVVPMHEYHDLTSQSLLQGTLKRAEPRELQSVQDQFASHFKDYS